MVTLRIRAAAIRATLRPRAWAIARVRQGLLLLGDRSIEPQQDEQGLRRGLGCGVRLGCRVWLGCTVRLGCRVRRGCGVRLGVMS